MAIRLNYTGRKKLSGDHASIALRNDAGGLRFDANIDLSSYKLDPQALVFVEAYRQTAWMRFEFGRVGSRSMPTTEQRRLTLFDVPQGILFRVKVTTDVEPRGKLLAQRDRIRPIQPDEQEQRTPPLIDWKPQELGDELWRVDFSEVPLLLLNKRLTGFEELLADPRFKAQVAPAIMRQVLTRFLMIDKNAGSEDEEDDPASRWMAFARALPGVGDVPDDLEKRDEVEDWIDSAVQSFCKGSQTFDRFLHVHQGGTPQ